MISSVLTHSNSVPVSIGCKGKIARLNIYRLRFLTFRYGNNLN